MMRHVVSGIAGFGRFWYEFIVGDDPLMAAGVALGLAAASILLHASVNAWWLVPPLVIVILGASLRRASRFR
jgi:hypothetical protein